MKNQEVIVEIKNLKKYFINENRKDLKAVDNINLKLKKGETFGLVGESGCGKSTLGRTIAGLYNPTDGDIIYKGIKTSEMNTLEKRGLKKQLQIIFQDPYASLNPRMTVGDIIAEGIDIFGMYNKKQRDLKIKELLGLVGLHVDSINRFPHEFSGGQRQRIGIARALAIKPEFIVCDEPISALDVSIQAQIINLLIDLQKKFELTYLFIAHDLSMVKHISDRIGVMYLGGMIEIAPSENLYSKPLHPYTKGLINAIPIADPMYEDSKEEEPLEGELPNPLNPPSGCKFRTRCKLVKDICKIETPLLTEVETNHFCACHFVN